MSPLEARLLGRREPVADDLLEFLGGHARVGGRHELDDALLAGAASVFMSPSRMALKGSGPSTRGARGERLDAVEDEGELDVHRLLGPERAVVVEHGDTIPGGTKSGLPCL